MSIEIQNSTAEELQNSIGELKSDIESLSRADVIAEKARNDLKMVFTHPETLRIEIDQWIHANYQKYLQHWKLIIVVIN